MKKTLIAGLVTLFVFWAHVYMLNTFNPKIASATASFNGLGMFELTHEKSVIMFDNVHPLPFIGEWQKYQSVSFVSTSSNIAFNMGDTIRNDDATMYAFCLAFLFSILLAAGILLSWFLSKGKIISKQCDSRDFAHLYYVELELEAVLKRNPLLRAELAWLPLLLGFMFVQPWIYGNQNFWRSYVSWIYISGIIVYGIRSLFLHALVKTIQNSRDQHSADTKALS
ncbi:MAG: hypothetical protein V4478_00805 [Patescibacteria group bacterium]